MGATSGGGNVFLPEHLSSQEEFEDNKRIIIMVNKAKKDKRQRII
jgi:hypothetical protein